MISGKRRECGNSDCRCMVAYELALNFARANAELEQKLSRALKEVLKEKTRKVQSDARYVQQAEE